MSEPIAVVGGGIVGLSIASTLAACQPVVLIERLPMSGGGWGYDNPVALSLAQSCCALKVRMFLGTTAIRWTDGVLTAVGPTGGLRLRARHLVFAGGSRPATAAELGVVGGRLAGVFAAPVALHLLEAGTVLGWNVVLAGSGDWSRILAPHIGASSHLTLVGDELSAVEPPNCHGWWPGYRLRRITGVSRVAEVLVENAGQAIRLPCDAVVLCGDSRPVRTVDGAIRAGEAQVTYVQPTTQGLAEEQVVAIGEESARALLKRMEECSW